MQGDVSEKQFLRLLESCYAVGIWCINILKFPTRVTNLQWQKCFDKDLFADVSKEMDFTLTSISVFASVLNAINCRNFKSIRQIKIFH